MGGKERLVELCDLPLDPYQHCRQTRQSSANSLRAVSFIFQNGDQLPDIASALWCHNAKLGKVTTQGTYPIDAAKKLNAQPDTAAEDCGGA
jgi:hypothetical protein